MKDLGLNEGLVQKFETSDKRSKHAFFGFRKMFWDYLTKMNVVFDDPCCAAAKQANRRPLSYNEVTNGIEYYSGSNWTPADAVLEGLSNGTVGAPSVAFASDTDTGMYRIGANEIGFATNGAKVLDISTTGLAITGSVSTTTGVATDSITEVTAGHGITLSKPIIRQPGTAKVLNTTGAITAAELAGGLVTTTTAAAVTGTLPTATLLGTQIGAVKGTQFEFVVDNSGGANGFTLAVNTGITVGTTALTGGDSLTLSVAQAVAVWRLVFTSATTAILRRIV